MSHDDFVLLRGNIAELLGSVRGLAEMAKEDMAYRSTNPYLTKGEKETIAECYPKLEAILENLHYFGRLDVLEADKARKARETGDE